MGKIYKFSRKHKKQTYPIKTVLFIVLIAVAALIAQFFILRMPDEPKPVQIHYGTPKISQIICNSPRITDGDTFRCDGVRIRLQGIDAPEMNGHCRPGRKCVDGDPIAAKNYLHSITRGRVTCRQADIDSYGRTIGLCESGGVDLSCAMIGSGHAVRRYARIQC